MTKQEQAIEAQIEFEKSAIAEATAEDVVAIATTELVEQLTPQFYMDIMQAGSLTVEATLDGVYNCIMEFGDARVTRATVDAKGEVVKPGELTPAHTIKVVQRHFSCELSFNIANTHLLINYN